MQFVTSMVIKQNFLMRSIFELVQQMNQFKVLTTMFGPNRQSGGIALKMRAISTIPKNVLLPTKKDFLFSFK